MWSDVWSSLLTVMVMVELQPSQSMQTTGPLQTTFIIESISKTNNNILLTGGQ